MRRMCLVLMLVGGIGLVPHFAFSQSGNAAKDKAYQDAMQHLAFRSLGPASMDGRIDAFAVPRHADRQFPLHVDQIRSAG